MKKLLSLIREHPYKTIVFVGIIPAIILCILVIKHTGGLGIFTIAGCIAGSAFYAFYD